MMGFDFIGQTGSIDPLWILIGALALDGYVGDMTTLFNKIKHPVVWIGEAIAFFDEKLNRDNRSETNRMVRGFVLVVFMVLACIVIGWGIAWFGQNYPFGWALEMFLVLTLIAQKSLYEFVKNVATALDEGGLSEGRVAVSHIVGRDPDQLDEHGVSRAAIESLAENFGDGVVAPVFWYVLFGFPGLLVYKAVNTMDSMIGHKTDRHKAFGFSAARLDDILNLIPARLSGIWISLACLFSKKANALVAFKTMWRDAKKHRSPNAGWPEGAMAGGLGLALAGPRKYREGQINDAWIGSGKARATSDDIHAALKIYMIACAINFVIVFLIALA